MLAHMSDIDDLGGECCSADQRLLLKITIAEDARKSYTPQGIEKGIDFEDFAFRADAHSPRYTPNGDKVRYL